MTLKDLIKKFQTAIGATADGEYGPVTTAKADEFDVEIIVKKRPKSEEPAAALPTGSGPIWLDEAKKHKGKKESDSAFNRYLSGFWKIVGLPHYKTIIGSSFAWCGLFVAAMLYEVDLPFQKNGAGAKNWAKYGQEIDWKKDGIPRGAILHINHNQCGSGSGNHVAFANGDCASADLQKSGATIDLFGGNQNNTAKVSTYSVREICAVRWPPEKELPGKIARSVNCSGNKASGEPTR
jgi:hypothetical protein